MQTLRTFYLYGILSPQDLFIAERSALKRASRWLLKQMITLSGSWDISNLVSGNLVITDWSADNLVNTDCFETFLVPFGRLFLRAFGSHLDHQNQPSISGVIVWIKFVTSSLQTPSSDPDHSSLWMVIFLLLCGFCCCTWIPPFLTNPATALVYGQWRPSNTALTPSLFFLSAHLFEGDRPLRVLSGFPTSYSTPSSFLPQTTLLYLIWCFLEVHITSTYDLKTALRVLLLLFSPLWL